MDDRRRNKFEKQKKRFDKVGTPEKIVKRSLKNNTLVNVWLDTEKIALRNYRQYGVIHNINDIFVNNGSQRVPVIEVQNIDTLNMASARAQCDTGKVLVLNMCSDMKPGGGVRNGRTAQEEEIFRRTTACVSHDKIYYPLDEDDTIYCPNVTIIKDDTYKQITDIDISLISVAAIRHPRLRLKQYTPEDRDLMYRKVRHIFQIGIKYGHKSLILGALGCGAFKNPPNLVYEIFKEVIHEYGMYFDYIGFAILTTNDKDNINYEIFQQLIQPEKQ